MRLTRVVAAASLFAVASAASLRADQKTWFGFCTPGAVRACSSVQVITNLIAGGTSVTIRVRNEQGGFGDNSGGSLISKIGLVVPTVSGASGLSVNAVGGASSVGTAASNWSLHNPGNLGGQITLVAGIGVNGGPGGIQGCSTPFGGARSSYFQTCGSGWVELTFTTTTSWSANQAEVAVLTTSFAVNGQGFECGTVPTPNAGACVIATPEPVTMILLGSGLASMGGFGLVRRRKGTDIVND